MKIITREEWGAKHGAGNVTDGAKLAIVAHHDGPDRSKPDMTESQEKELMLFYEDFAVNGQRAVIRNGVVIHRAIPGLTRANPRITYNFVIMQSGRIYEGCGWGRIGAHVGGHNSSTIGVLFPLNGAKTPPTAKAIAAFHWLREKGMELGKLARAHEVKGHQDYNKPACPGRLVYRAIVLGVAPAPEPITLPVVIASHPTLRLGKGGKNATPEERELVRYLQGRLISLGFMQSRLPSGKDARDGDFGTITDTAVRKFQVAKGLRRNELGGSALFGPASWKALGV